MKKKTTKLVKASPKDGEQDSTKKSEKNHSNHAIFVVDWTTRERVTACALSTMAVVKMLQLLLKMVKMLVKMALIS